MHGDEGVTMDTRTTRSRGFTLVATMLLLVLMSAMAIGLLMMVNTEGRVGGGDLQSDVAYHNAEGAIEKMTSDLANTFKNIQSPQPSDITNLSKYPPVTPGVVYSPYTLSPALTTTGALNASYGQIQGGSNAGLWAQIIPIALNVSASQANGMGQQVSMMRTVEVALIPVFQFGVFCEGDCGFFSSPNLDFAGRVHTNGDLYLGVATGYSLTFHDKLSAYGNVVRKVLPNGLDGTNSSYNDGGTVSIPTASQGCDGTKPACRSIAQTEGSVVGAGGNPPGSAQNSNWPNVSLSTYNGIIIDGNYGQSGGTGAKSLSLPFVTGTNFPYQIIRRPPAGEGVTSALGQSRLYNQAQIRVLISDDPNDLPGGAADTTNNIRLANLGPYVNGVPASVKAGLPGLGGAAQYTTYFATASTATPDPSAWLGKNTQTCLPADWPNPPSTQHSVLQPTGTPGVPATGAAPGAPIIGAVGTYPVQVTGVATADCLPAAPIPAANFTPTSWSLIDGWIRVDYKDVNGNWHPVTAEWLGLGIARDVNSPAAGLPNDINPNAILIFQQPADRDGTGGAIDTVGAAAVCSGSPRTCGIAKPPDVYTDATTTQWAYGSSAVANSVTQNNWYPINFYDAREGEVRDVIQTDNSCTVNGVMNAVELDVGNLSKWLSGGIGTTGKNVDFQVQNGYILYFSDRRGMLPDPNLGNTKSGDSGLEDSINAANPAGTPDGVLDPTPPGKKNSAEDVNLNGVLDNFGAPNLGDGFNNGTTSAGFINTWAPLNQYGAARITSCGSTARKNRVSGARHVLKLVDGSLGNLPVRPDNSAGGFTVASENPVYVQGDYNTNANDTIWKGGSGGPHAAAAVIADAVTVLSDAWTDRISLVGVPNPTQASSRLATTTYYRLAIAAGKNLAFPFPSWNNAVNYGFGTDGGIHNFLRFLEDWSGSTLNYEGSLVSLYYSTYATGTFKCCTYSVYQPPTRNYVFDPLFATPSGLPPGTPMFRDVDDLAYRQVFTPRTSY
jgi:hypothetical protein